MLVRPNAGEQSHPAGAAERRLFTGLPSDAAGIGQGVMQAPLELSVVTQCFVLLKLNAIDTDQQRLGVLGRRLRTASCEQ
ncbi:hypothetical protein D3C76_1070000 [compost metagenome]